MGEVIYLDRLRSDPSLGPRAPRVRARETPVFLFDLASPESYLVAERVERALGGADWTPVDGSRLLGETGRLTGRGDRPRRLGLDERRRRAESLARAQRLPLVWPERFPAPVSCALRAAAYACELGAGASFALAAFRLAFCGGFDLDDPETLAEAAAAAGVPLEECLAAAGETWRDQELQTTAEHLRARGVLELPAIGAGGRWFAGESGLLAASVSASTSASASGSASRSASASASVGAQSLVDPLAPLV